MDEVENNTACAEMVGTVASSVLGKFFDELGAIDDLSDVATSLKNLVLDDGVFAEPAVRGILFADIP